MAQIGYGSENKVITCANHEGGSLGVDGVLITSDSKDIHGDGRWTRPTIHSKDYTKFGIQEEVV